MSRYNIKTKLTVYIDPNKTNEFSLSPEIILQKIYGLKLYLKWEKEQQRGAQPDIFNIAELRKKAAAVIDSQLLQIINSINSTGHNSPEILKALKFLGAFSRGEKDAVLEESEILTSLHKMVKSPQQQPSIQIAESALNKPEPLQPAPVQPAPKKTAEELVPKLPPQPEIPTQQPSESPKKAENELKAEQQAVTNKPAPAKRPKKVVKFIGDIQGLPDSLKGPEVDPGETKNVLTKPPQNQQNSQPQVHEPVLSGTHSTLASLAANANSDDASTPSQNKVSQTNPQTLEEKALAEKMLKLSNIAVNSSFTDKIQILKEIAEAHANLNHGSQHVYSFGILFFEVLSEVSFTTFTPSDQTRLRQGLAPRETNTKTKAGWEKYAATPADITDLVRACFQSDPNERPDFKTILSFLNKLLEPQVSTAPANTV